MRADIDPYSLRLFLAVCEEGSIVRCADREATVPSAVSKRMAALEALMGLPLLRRGPRGMEPTDAGQSLARHAREVLAGMERLRSAMDALVQGGEGSVRILASLAAISSHLTADLVPVLARHRSLKVSLAIPQTLLEAVGSCLVERLRLLIADQCLFPSLVFAIAQVTAAFGVVYLITNDGVGGSTLDRPFVLLSVAFQS